MTAASSLSKTPAIDANRRRGNGLEVVCALSKPVDLGGSYVEDCLGCAHRLAKADSQTELAVACVPTALCALTDRSGSLLAFLNASYSIHHGRNGAAYYDSVELVLQELLVDYIAARLRQKTTPDPIRLFVVTPVGKELRPEFLAGLRADGVPAAPRALAPHESAVQRALGYVAVSCCYENPSQSKLARGECGRRTKNVSKKVESYRHMCNVAKAYGALHASSGASGWAWYERPPGYAKKFMGVVAGPEVLQYDRGTGAFIGWTPTSQLAEWYGPAGVLPDGMVFEGVLRSAEKRKDEKEGDGIRGPPFLVVDVLRKSAAGGSVAGAPLPERLAGTYEMFGHMFVRYSRDPAARELSELARSTVVFVQDDAPYSTQKPCYIWKYGGELLPHEAVLGVDGSTGRVFAWSARSASFLVDVGWVRETGVGNRGSSDAEGTAASARKLTYWVCTLPNAVDQPEAWAALEKAGATWPLSDTDRVLDVRNLLAGGAPSDADVELRFRAIMAAVSAPAAAGDSGAHAHPPPPRRQGIRCRPPRSVM